MRRNERVRGSRGNHELRGAAAYSIERHGFEPQPALRPRINKRPLALHLYNYTHVGCSYSPPHYSQLTGITCALSMHVTHTRAKKKHRGFTRTPVYQSDKVTFLRPVVPLSFISTLYVYHIYMQRPVFQIFLFYIQ